MKLSPANFSTVLVLALVTLVACSQSTSPAVGPTPASSAGQSASPGPAKANRPTGSLTVAVPSLGVEDMLPINGTKTNKIYWDAIYDYLLYVDPKTSKLIPGLAAEWKMADDGLSYTFGLRKGVKFHNGDELTAADVQYTIDLITKQEGNNSDGPSLRKSISQVEAPDPYTVVFRLNAQTVELPAILSSFSGVPIVSKKYIAEKGIDFARANPMGSGPFTFVEHIRGQLVKLEAVQGEHWRKTPAFQNLTLRMIPEVATRLAMLKAGEADIIDLPLSLKGEVEAANLGIRRIPNAAVLGIFLGGQYSPTGKDLDPKNPFLKKEVRQALNLAINRQELLGVWKGEGAVAPMYPSMPGTAGFDDSLKPYPYDPEAAKKLLASAGYPNGFETTLWLIEQSGAPGHTDAAQAVAMHWERVGVKTKLVPIDLTRVVAEARARKLSNIASTNARSFWRPEETYFLQTQFTTDSVVHMGEYPEVDDLTSKIGKELNDQKRIDYLRQVNRFLYDEYVVVPLAYVPFIYGVSNKVGDWSLIPGYPQPHNFEYVAHK